MDLTSLHDKIQLEISQGSRALQKLDGQTITELNQALVSSEGEKLSQVILIANHLSHSERSLSHALIYLLKKDLPIKDTIILLNAARLHVIDGAFKAGERLSLEFLEVLRLKLYHKRPEVREWALRIVDQCGSQSIVFRGDLARIKPRPWQFFKAEWRVVLELITFIERKWQAHERPSTKNP